MYSSNTTRWSPKSTAPSFLRPWTVGVTCSPSGPAEGACSVSSGFAGRGGDGAAVGDLRIAGGAPQAGESAVVDEAWVIRRAGELLAEDDLQSARAIVRDALEAFGRRSDLLWLLADAEFAGGDFIAGREYLDEALAAGPRDAASAAREIRTLRGAGFWREALSVIQAVPGELRGDPLVRTEAGDFYRACKCPAYAADSYSQGPGLPRPARTSRRWCWLRSGGPSRRLRRRSRASEEHSLQELWYPPAHITALSAVEGLDSRQVRRVRAQMETIGYRNTRDWHTWRELHRAGYRLIPLAAVPVWLVLLAVVSLAGFSTDPVGAVGFAAVSAAVATIPVIAAARAIIRPDGKYRRGFSVRAVAFFLFAVMAGEAAAAEGYANQVMPAAGLQGAVILGLIAAPAAAACLPIAAIAAAFPRYRLQRRMILQDTPLVATDILLNVLYDLRLAGACRPMGQRLRHCRNLEYAARWLSRDLLPTPVVSRLGSGDWLARRAAGWAEAIRHIQRQVIAPTPGGQGKAEALLTHEIRCLVTGDLGALAWREPPPPPSRRATIRRQAVSAARAIVVAALPLAAVLAAQPLVHASPALFGWARIATAVWALLYVLLSIDPAMRDKIGAARDLASLIQTTPAPGSRDIQQHR